MADTMQTLYDDYLTFTNDQVGKNDPLLVAAIMMAQSLSIYRSVLDDADYSSMVDTIISRRNEVQAFNNQTVQ
jgi:hypothetical protein